MAVFSDIREKLQHRLGLGAIGTIQTKLLNEALNAGALRAASDGVPGLLRDVFIAHTYEELSIACSGHDVDDNDINTTIGGVDTALTTKNVFPHDIIKLGDVTLLVKNVLAADRSQIEIGAPYHTSLNGETGTIVRRSIELPTTGQIIAVRAVDGNKLEPHAQNAAYVPIEEGTAMRFEQRYDSTSEKSHLILYPAPSSSTAYSIIQAENVTSLSASAAYSFFSDEVVDAVLERALKAYRGWNEGTSQIGLAASEGAVIDTSDQLKNSSNTKQGYVRY
jgi:hypothetical protein